MLRLATSLRPLSHGIKSFARTSCLLQSRHAFSSTNEPDQPQLVRDFIASSLYDVKSGYFNDEDVECVTYSNETLNFKKMKTQDDFYAELHKLYAKSEHGWLTQAEIFQPYYATAILEWILLNGDHLKSSYAAAAKHLHILEIGGGNGTCGINILDDLKKRYPKLYKRTTYTFVDVSHRLSTSQRRNVEARGHLARCRFVNKSIVDWDVVVSAETFVIGLEVLDNFTHDKVRRVSRTGSLTEQFVECTVHKESNGDEEEYVEATRPLQDPLITECVEHYTNFRAEQERSMNWYVRMTEKVVEGGDRYDSSFMPTTSLAFLHMLHKHFPNHHLLLADFDYLPTTIKSNNAPIVSRKTGVARRTTNDSQVDDYDSYLRKPGTADVFFATNFDFFVYMYEKICQPVTVANAVKNSNFIDFFGDHTRTMSTTGYSPMMDEYPNISIFVGSSFQSEEYSVSARGNVK